MMNNKKGFIGPVNLGNTAETPIIEFAKIIIELALLVSFNFFIINFIAGSIISEIINATRNGI